MGRIVFAFLSIAISGCSIQEIYADNDLIQRRISFGSGTHVVSNDAVTRIESRVYGGSVDRQGVIIGLSTKDETHFPPGTCQAVFFVDDVEGLKALLIQFPEIDQACVLKR